jgi:hypothetical protein
MLNFTFLADTDTALLASESSLIASICKLVEVIV